MFYIKQNDTGPPLQATLYNADGTLVDLSGASSVRFHMKKKNGSSVKVDATGQIVSTNGVVQYRWTAGDTDTAGEYWGEFEITFSGGAIRTYPNDGNLEIQVFAEIA